ncbi:hypothetical protein [Amycolatopsis sp. DSM 110486]|uniref:hypothetical protein n=1 Tax=Amycolatopsis sp. DSM 110486 TaxID=2865832 RepID=UPI001C6A22CE|nr:hypothetical protein [Amycolatopsis sp. DSM 110486]QYN23126.1 hypothetical protein K1T34_12105 [Amycolatopsis sp. DSM 110486]
MSDVEPSGELSVPEPSWVDRVRKLTLGALGAIPVAGSAASAIVDIVWRPEIEKRTEEFLKALVAEIGLHDSRIDGIEKLIVRDTAISAGISGARAASRTSDPQKLRYLASAVTRVTIDSSWDAQADFAMLLLQIADDLTVTHVRVLSWFNSAEWPGILKAVQNKEKSMEDALQEAFPEDDPLAIKGMIADLAARSLIVIRGSFFGLSTFNPESISELGIKFLDFVSELDS